MHIDELKYGNIGGGLFDGMCAIHLSFGTSTRTTPIALLSSIFSFARTKVVRLYGPYSGLPEDEVETVVRSLRDNGYAVTAVLPGDQSWGWVESVGYRVVEVSEEPWLLYRSEEIHFKPTARADLKPPQLTALHSSSILYLDISSGEIPPLEVFAFTKQNPLWRLYSEPRKSYRMTVPLKEEE